MRFLGPNSSKSMISSSWLQWVTWPMSDLGEFRGVPKITKKRLVCTGHQKYVPLKKFIGSWSNQIQIQILKSNRLPRRLEAAIRTVPPGICRVFFFGDGRWDSWMINYHWSPKIAIFQNSFPNSVGFEREFWTLRKTTTDLEQKMGDFFLQNPSPVWVPDSSPDSSEKKASSSDQSAGTSNQPYVFLASRVLLDHPVLLDLKTNKWTDEKAGSPGCQLAPVKEHRKE